LYDGQQWLVQRYRINNITAASLTELNTKPQRQMQVLAGAFATGRYSFTVGGESFDFAGLPFAGTEVENLAKTVPTTPNSSIQPSLPQVTVPKMDDYTVVHLATHAAFVRRGHRTIPLFCLVMENASPSEISKSGASRTSIW
jgi:CHAT domain-containing protein